MTTLNVRLGEDDARLVRELKRRGISISAVVRAALRGEVQRSRQGEAMSANSLLAEMMNRFPTPESTASRQVNAADRRQVQRAIRERLRRRG